MACPTDSVGMDESRTIVPFAASVRSSVLRWKELARSRRREEERRRGGGGSK